MRALTLAVAGLIAATTPCLAHAAAPGKAERYEQRGKKAYRGAKFDDAIVAFELAYDAKPKPKYLFNIGRCWEKKGDLFKAMEFIQRYVADVEEEGERQDAQEVYSILRGKLLRSAGEVSLDSDPSGAEVRLVGEDDQELAGTTPLTRWLAAGRWKVQIAREGYEIFEGELFIAVGKTVDRSFKLERPAPPTKKPVAAVDKGAVGNPGDAPPPSSARPGASGPGLGIWASLAGGAALLAGGVVLGVMGQAEEEVIQGGRSVPRSITRDEAKSAVDSAERLALGANLLFALGGAAVATGAALWLTNETFVAAAAPGGVVVGGRW